MPPARHLAAAIAIVVAVVAALCSRAPAQTPPPISEDGPRAQAAPDKIRLGSIPRNIKLVGPSERGADAGDIALDLRAPEGSDGIVHTGTPTLHFTVSGGTWERVAFTLMSRVPMRMWLDIDLPPVAAGQLQTIDLGRLGVTLVEHRVYNWSIAVYRTAATPDAEARVAKTVLEYRHGPPPPP